MVFDMEGCRLNLYFSSIRDAPLSTASTAKAPLSRPSPMLLTVSGSRASSPRRRKRGRLSATISAMRDCTVVSSEATPPSRSCTSPCSRHVVTLSGMVKSNEARPSRSVAVAGAQRARVQKLRRVRPPVSAPPSVRRTSLLVERFLSTWALEKLRSSDFTSTSFLMTGASNFCPDATLPNATTSCRLFSSSLREMTTDSPLRTVTVDG